MKRIISIFVLILISISVYAREVPANNQGIAKASPRDHIIRSSGEKVALKQSDIDYVRKQLGISGLNIQPRTTTQNNNNSSGFRSSSNSDYGGVIVFLLVVVGIIIIIGFCVSNIASTVAKNSGMNEKKIGKSASVLAGTAAVIGAAALISISGGINSKKIIINE